MISVTPEISIDLNPITSQYQIIRDGTSQNLPWLSQDLRLHLKLNTIPVPPRDAYEAEFSNRGFYDVHGVYFDSLTGSRFQLLPDSLGSRDFEKASLKCKNKKTNRDALLSW